MTPETFVRVTRREPCPICEKPDYCTRTADGKRVKCMRVENGKPALKNGGWLHVLEHPLPLATPKPARRLKDIPGLAKKLYGDRLAKSKREALAKLLGVAESALEALRVGIGWDHDSREFSSWPSRDSAGRIIGISRRYEDGQKRTLAGTSNAGVFLTPRWWAPLGPIVIVEGGSDVAALVSNGFAAIGRPSNTGGHAVIKELLARRAPKRPVLVMGENDRKANRIGTANCPADCTGCSWCWPGLFGAQLIAQRLGCGWKMPPPLYKDVRQWAMADLDFANSFRALIGAGNEDLTSNGKAARPRSTEQTPKP